MPTRRPSILLFDFDGTLSDSMGGYARLFCDILAGIGVAKDLSLDIYLSMAGRGPHDQFREVLRRTDKPADAKALTSEFWRRAESESPLLFPEAPEVLATLHGEGHTLFITSGGRTNVVRERAALGGIDGYFRLILGTDDGIDGMAKGQGHLRQIAADLGISTAQLATHAWLIGDGPFDMEVAREAGITSVGRLTGDNGASLLAAGARFLIRDLTELGRLLVDEWDRSAAI
jgi:phosphoglycolate phosphatase-like HAD superfamily hydrolase